MSFNNHSFDEHCLKLIRSVNNNNYLDAYDNLELNKYRKVLNNDKGNFFRK